MHSLLHCCAGSKKYSPVTHVIFDLDGTIIDSESVYAKALKQAVEDYGCEYYDEFITKIKGRTEKDTAGLVLETFNLDATSEEFLEKYNGNASAFLGNLELMPGAERMIRHLHKNNIPLAVATSSAQASFELKTNKFEELFSCFHHIVCGGTDPEVTIGKPAPDIFLIAASRFDNPPDPSKCLVFEDSANGMKAGIAAGMQVVMIPEPDIPYEIWKEATLRLDSFNYMIPDLFGLPPFPDEDMAPVFAETKVELYEVPPISINLDDPNEPTSEAQKEETPATEDEETAETPNEE